MAKGKTEAVPAPDIDEEWRARDDADTLARAAEVIGDKKRFEKAKAYVEKKQKGLDQLMSGLRRRA